MKKGIMKLTVMTFVLALVFSTTSMAQRGGGNGQKVKGEKPTAEERATRMTEKMTKKLELNDYQSDQIGYLNTSLAQDLAELKDSDMEREEKKAAAEQLRAAYNTQVAGILDAEQNEKFLKWQENRKGKKGGKKGKGKKGGKRGGADLDE